jgi:hypothetical protein
MFWLLVVALERVTSVALVVVQVVLFMIQLILYPVHLQ